MAMPGLSLILFAALAFSCSAFAQLTPDQEAAKDQGLALYQQSDWYDSQPLLEIAAEAGDKEAQYYLGEAIRLSKRYMVCPGTGGQVVKSYCSHFAAQIPSD